MQDRELIEFAAKASGIEGWWETEYLSFIKRSGGVWAPLDDDGDAFRLAVKLHLGVLSEDVSSVAWDFNFREEVTNKDSCMATRRAIVLCAAKIGKEM
jgi:hypothetical protein